MCIKIVLNNIAVWANIGITDDERSTKQPLLITVSFEYDASQAQRSDRIDDAVDYANIRTDVLTLVQPPVHLLEHLVYTLKTHIAERYPIQAVHVSIKKPNAFSDVEYVNVSA